MPPSQSCPPYRDRLRFFGCETGFHGVSQGISTRKFVRQSALPLLLPVQSRGVGVVPCSERVAALFRRGSGQRFIEGGQFLVDGGLLDEYLTLLRSGLARNRDIHDFWGRIRSLSGRRVKGRTESLVGLRNPQHLAWNDVGDLFTGDNNADGGDKARWTHIVEGAEYGWRLGW